jgi:hypothetical protein
LPPKKQNLILIPPDFWEENPIPKLDLDLELELDLDLDLNSI